MGPMYNLFSPLIKIYKALYLFAYDMTGNYGVALVLLSLFTFAVLYPFNKKAQQIQNTEHKIQAILSPQIDEIKKQYTGREQYEQLQWLYKRYGYHPLYAIRSALGFVFQIPFLTAAYYMLSGLTEIQGVAWGFIPNLGQPDHLLAGVNLLPFVMTLVTCVYAFVLPATSKKERLQTVAIGIFFLIFLYNAPSALLIFWTCNLFWSFLDNVLGKKLECWGNFISENEMAFHIILAFSLTVGLLVPLEIYIKNANELLFDFKDFLKLFFTDTAKYFFILLLIYIFCWRKKTRNIYLSILSGLLIALFLQSYIISIDYGMFDGHEINWDKYTCFGFANSFIWFFCLGGFYILFKRFEFNTERIKSFLKPISFCVIVIQCVVLVFTLKSNPIQKDIVFEKGKTGILTSKNLYTASSKENIIVFLLDGYDASVFEEIQQKDPGLLHEFKDFIYYPDTTSSFGYTYYSLPEILTGDMYEPQENYSEYLQKAWKETPYFKLLVEKNYLVDLYTSGRYVAEKTLIDNLTIEKVELNDKVVDYFKALTKFRMAPHYLKQLYYQYQPEILNFAVMNANCKPYEENDRAFYVDLKKNFNISNKTNFFKFYHLRGMHEPFVLDENAELVHQHESGYYKQALGCLRIVKEYIALMKQHNAYHNSTFVIMADHGKHNEVGSRPIFLVKQPGITHNTLAVDSSPMRIGELMPIIFQRFNGYKGNRFEISGTDDKRFYYFEIGQQFIKYHVKSPANNISSWFSQGKVKTNLVLDRKYGIGDSIDFSFDGNSRKYKNNGWREKEDWEGTYIFGREADIILDIQDAESIRDDVTIIVRSGAYLRKQSLRTVKMFVNNTFVKSWDFKNDTNDNMYFQVDNHCDISKELLSKQTPLRVQFITEGRNQNDGISEYDQTILIEKFQILTNL